MTGAVQESQRPFSGDQTSTHKGPSKSGCGKKIRRSEVIPSGKRLRNYGKIHDTIHG